MIPTESAWLLSSGEAPTPTARLVCIPYAGAGPSAYRRWRKLLPDKIELLIAALPGREQRLNEPPERSMSTVVQMLADALRGRADRPLYLFGHSLGALISYELAHELVSRGIEPAHLFVSAHAAPVFTEVLSRTLHGLPDDELGMELVKLGGLPADLVVDRELFNIFLPALRADLEMGETYQHARRQPLRCPVTAFGGRTDGGASAEVLMAWRAETRAPFDLRLFDGGHFYIQECLEEVTRHIRSRIEESRQKAKTRGNHYPLDSPVSVRLLGESSGANYQGEEVKRSHFSDRTTAPFE